MYICKEACAGSMSTQFIHVGAVLTTFDGNLVTCRVALVCATLDLPARAAVLNFTQFNGYWGCCRCLQKGCFYINVSNMYYTCCFTSNLGKRVTTSKQGGTQTYPYIEKNPCGPPRTHKQTCEDGSAALSSGSNVCAF